MGVFSRISDIINSNLNALLDKAEDPEKLVKMIIQEMEQTLVEVRSSSARTIAQKKELSRHIESQEKEIEQWQQKAEIAINKGRDDLAKAALMEKRRLSDLLELQQQELAKLEGALQSLDADIGRLQIKLNEAKARRDAILLRQKTLVKQKSVRQQTSRVALDLAVDKFEAFERRMDQLEAEVEALDLGQNNNLSAQIDSLVVDEKLEQEMKELKRKMAQS